jgi:hypothetical protein
LHPASAPVVDGNQAGAQHRTAAVCGARVLEQTADVFRFRDFSFREFYLWKLF